VQKVWRVQHVVVLAAQVAVPAVPTNNVGFSVLSCEGMRKCIPFFYYIFEYKLSTR
jgi:hypothetical protein